MKVKRILIVSIIKKFRHLCSEIQFYVESTEMANFNDVMLAQEA